MKKAEDLGYQTVGVEKDPNYIKQAPKNLNIIKGDINYYKPEVSFLALCACIHYHQTDEQVEALLHNLLYSTLHILVMGRHKGATKSRPDRDHITKKLRGWQFIDGRRTNRFYTVLFRNPRYAEFDVDSLYAATVEYVSKIKGFLNFVPSFEDFVRRTLNGDLDIRQTPFLKHLKQRRMKYPYGRCWIYRLLIEEIRRHGLNTALKVHDGRISDGYHRLIILRELGIKRVICRV